MKALLNSLTEAEILLVRQTEPADLAALDEDELIDLHARIRRARNKYSTLYRRVASSRVREYGGRGKARPKNTRNAGKAEVFEQALARVSRSLASAARRSATELRAERLKAARAVAGSAPRRPVQQSRSTPAVSQQSRRRPAAAAATSPTLRKRQAAGQAAGARRQAKRDSR